MNYSVVTCHDVYNLLKGLGKRKKLESIYGEKDEANTVNDTTV